MMKRKPDKHKLSRHQKEEKWIRLDRGQDKAQGDGIKIGKTFAVYDISACQ